MLIADNFIIINQWRFERKQGHIKSKNNKICDFYNKFSASLMFVRGQVFAPFFCKIQKFGDGR